jgi:hypothetical protein
VLDDFEVVDADAVAVAYEFDCFESAVADVDAPGGVPLPWCRLLAAGGPLLRVWVEASAKLRRAADAGGCHFCGRTRRRTLWPAVNEAGPAARARALA